MPATLTTHPPCVALHMQVDLNLKVVPFYIKRYHAPTIVLLRWKRCDDGL